MPWLRLVIALYLGLGSGLRSGLGLGLGSGSGFELELDHHVDDSQHRVLGGIFREGDRAVGSLGLSRRRHG